MFTIAEENYIKSIYHLQKTGSNVTTNQLAGKMNTKPASVTDMLKKLENKKLLSYEKYYGVKLTTEGRRLALVIVRRHRLWEYFLVNNLAFGWEEVHSIAEQLEHVQSPELVDKLDAFLGFPRFDPHGDPIPDGKGKMELQQQYLLGEWPLGRVCELCAVGRQDESLLDMLKKKKLSMGTRLTIQQQYHFDKSLELALESGEMVTISEQLAKNIYVKSL